MEITKALIIDEPWISKILNGEKDWEMRSTNCNLRGPFGLIRKASGCVVGVAELSGVSGPYDNHALEQEFEHHKVGAEIYTAPDYKWRYAWEMTGVVALEDPVPYVHKNGAVTWVALDEESAQRVSQQWGQQLKNTFKTEKKGSIVTLNENKKLSTDSVTVTLTQGNINNNHFYLTSVLDFFPRESIGGENKNALAEKLLSIDAGEGELIKTDIAGDKNIFRNRAMMGGFIKRNKLQAGDKLTITRIGSDSYRLAPCR